MNKNTEVTAIFFSCTRLDLLARTIQSFMAYNTYPMKEIIIVNDSGQRAIHEQLKKSYREFTLVLNVENVGLMKSIDQGYAHIKTEYFYHCEDDWCCNGRGGFIEKSLAIMQKLPEIEEVWLADYNEHPLHEEIREVKGVQFRVAQDHQFGGIWHGFTTACGLKRMSDYRRVGPYSEIARGETIWHHECAIGQKYFDLGYRTACLLDEYVINLGMGKSEYKTGYEK
jgi:hypothetical protein